MKWLRTQLGEYQSNLMAILKEEELASTALTLCMRLLKAEGDHLNGVGEYQFPHGFLNNVLTILPVQGIPLAEDTLYVAFVRSGIPGAQGNLAASLEMAQLTALGPGMQPPPGIPVDYAHAVEALRAGNQALESIAAMTVFRTGHPSAELRAYYAAPQLPQLMCSGSPGVQMATLVVQTSLTWQPCVFVSQVGICEVVPASLLTMTFVSMEGLGHQKSFVLRLSDQAFNSKTITTRNRPLKFSIIALQWLQRESFK